MKYLIHTLPLLLAILTSCTTVQPLGTPSKKPEIVIATTNTDAVKSRIISACAGAGYTLTQESSSLLVFSKPWTGAESVLYQAMIGGASASQPQLVIRFTIASLGGRTQVFATISATMQYGLGRTDSADYSATKFGHELQTVLLQIKADIEGTNSSR